jgi:hypothetical protein
MSPRLAADLTRALGDLDALMNIGQVRAHFGGRSKMCIERWLRREGLDFPKPIYIAGQRYWRRGDILAFVERQAQASQSATGV